METHRVGARALVISTIALVMPISALAATPTEPSPNAPALVAAALKTELEGRTDQRQALLEAALSRDPEYAPARWQSGYVRWNDQWLTPEQVAKEVAGDKTLAEYRQRRGAMIDTAEAHRELARWCHKNQLADQQRIHWSKVLEFNPQDAEALAGLGLQLHEGRLMTKGQIAEAKQLAGERLRAMKHWQPQMVKWRKAIEHGPDAERAKALDALKTLDDPKAMPAFEATFGETGTGKTADRLNLLLIEAIDRVHAPETAGLLARFAAFSPSQQVREAACSALKKRPRYEYVPQLIAAMPPRSSAEMVYQVQFLPGGFVQLIAESSRQEGRSEFNQSYDLTVGSFWFSIARHSHGIDWQQSMNRVSGAVASLQRQALSEKRRQAENTRLRAQIASVLEQTTDFEPSDDPEEWQRQWNAYQETYTPELSTQPAQTYSQSASSFVMNVVQYSCFVAGTPVVTSMGPRPIEQIKPGDEVLSQAVDSGELAYHPVQAVTLRPASPLVKITLGSQSLLATRGHPFWVDGQGWTMAKQLKVGQILHSLDGAVVIDALEEAPAQEAYNLVVADGSTYFVGERPVLVHDNKPLVTTLALVPGLLAGAVQ